MKNSALFSTAALLLLSGCSLAPHYERPAAPVAAAYPTGPAYAANADAGVNAAELGWRVVFGDAYLQRLITAALQNNRDLRVAVLNIEAARAQYRIRRAAQLPAIDASASGNSQGIPAGVGVPGGASTSGRRMVIRDNQVAVGVTAFELDLFGRVQSMKDQALQQYFSIEATRRSSQISLIAEVANTYLTLLADRDLLQLTHDTLRNQQGAYDLIKRRFDLGVSSELDLQQAQTAVETARVDLAQYTRQVAQDMNALTLLIGTALPEKVPDDVPLDRQNLLTDLPSGLPADLLQQRPDIAAAEHDLLAANANIGAARAAFFPRVSLTSSIGTASPTVAGLFDAGTSAWSFAPKILLPIFRGGENTANLDLATTQKNIYVARYEQRIQIAFREVADALAARGTLDEQLAAQQRLVKASADSYRLAEARYLNGVDSYLNSLVSQRALYSAQQNLIVTQLRQLSSRITLYKVLGGGWSERGVAVARAGEQ